VAPVAIYTMISMTLPVDWAGIQSPPQCKLYLRLTFTSCSTDIKRQLRPKLEEFRRRIFKTDWESYDDDMGLYTDALVLTDKHITLLVINCTRYPTFDDLKALGPLRRAFLTWISEFLTGRLSMSVSHLLPKLA
jgi:hypothetical protein